ncbi:hypothetical protein LX32DRAFT_636380 [Colletotrichum zoysiae]|uniref:Uncharacterized protein n=1 Tax=Colletotrichum zoysiae TaxID=1216348 RepID=A0AAD9M5E8_9PEZI|nr:hypothetical protein LX32DRAFT_636380 [Colletotrichum zoysiae]
MFCVFFFFFFFSFFFFVSFLFWRFRLSVQALSDYRPSRFSPSLVVGRGTLQCYRRGGGSGQGRNRL